MNDYDLEIDNVICEIKKSKAKMVGLQFPEGLKDRALEVAQRIEASTKAKAVVMADPTYGVCDLKKDQARKLGIGMIIHFGHTRF